MIKLCRECGRRFKAKTKRAAYCCVRCKTKYRTKHMPVFERTCAGCGVLFSTTHAPARFCSYKCSTPLTVPTRELVCEVCGATFMFKGRTRKKRCAPCTREFNVKKQMRWKAKHNPTMKLGVGSGGAQWGKDNHMWKPEQERVSTRYTACYRQRCFKVWPRVCAACGATGKLEVHHINGDPANYAENNLIPLCFNCHIGRIHNRRYKEPQDYIDATYSILSTECRSKIAELSGKPISLGQPEPKAM